MRSSGVLADSEGGVGATVSAGDGGAGARHPAPVRSAANIDTRALRSIDRYDAGAEESRPETAPPARVDADGVQRSVRRQWPRQDDFGRASTASRL